MASRQETDSQTPMPDLVVVREPDSEGAQAYRSVRETLRHSRSEKPIRSILLADIGSGEHTGATAANLAASFALNGNTTVLVDLDIARPALSSLFLAPLTPGLLDWLEDSEQESAPELFPTRINPLSLLPSGSSSYTPERGALADLFTDRACQKLIDVLAPSTDFVIFHGSMAPFSSQALTTAANVDAVLLIVRSGVTKRTDAQRAKESLQRVGANLLGVVLSED